MTQSVCTTSTHPCWAQYNTGCSHKFTLLWLLSTSLICSLQILLACTAEAWTAPDLFALSCFVRTARKIQLNGVRCKTTYTIQLFVPRIKLNWCLPQTSRGISTFNNLKCLLGCISLAPASYSCHTSFYFIGGGGTYLNQTPFRFTISTSLLPVMTLTT